MKVLKLGSDIKSWQYIIICNYCKSEIEINADDLRYSGEIGDWHDAGWETYSCSCPACGNGLEVPPKNVPFLVKVAAQNRKNK
jgi:hypothetical protein